MRRALVGILFLTFTLPLFGQPKPPTFPPLNIAVAKQAQSATLETNASEAAFDDDKGFLAVAGEDRVVRVWKRVEGKDLLAPDAKPIALKGPASAITALAVSQGLCACASSDRKVHLWKLPDEKPSAVLTADKPVRALAISADGKLVAGALEDGGVQLWDEAGKPIRKLVGSADWLQAVAIAPDGKTVAAGGMDGKLWAWEAGSGKKLFDVLAQAPPPPKTEVATNVVTSLAFAPDGKQIALGGTDGKVYQFQANDGKFIRPMQTPHTAGVTAVVFHPGSAALVSAGKDRTIRLWNPTNGQALRSLEGHTGWVEGLAFLDKGTRLVTASADRTVRVWDLVPPPMPPKK